MSQPRYQVIERIDAGGMAEVFKASSSSAHGFKKIVAIKRILPSLTKNERFVRMFLDEAKVSLFLNHTNCVQIFELAIADGTYFIVMEFVNGTTLKSIIEELAQRGEPMPVEQAVYICLEVCKGLWHAHEKTDHEGKPLNIIHRDISPPNVLVSREGEVKITDFGLAKAQSSVEQTDPGVVKGKFGYLSPEAANGEPIDQRTDVFAVGILLWEMLMGRRLFLGRTDLETLRQVQQGRAPSVMRVRPDVPPELEAILQKTLTRYPHERYTTAKEMGEALAQFLFAYGKPVTNFNIATHVQRAMRSRQAVVESQKDSGVNAAVQRELERLVALEEIDDLDMYLAQMYSSVSDDETGEMVEGGSYEDPREWMSMGDHEGDWGEDFPVGPSGAHGLDGEPSTAWQQTELDELARPSGSNPNVNLSDYSEATKQMSRDQLLSLQHPDADPTGKMGRQQLSSALAAGGPQVPGVPAPSGVPAPGASQPAGPGFGVEPVGHAPPITPAHTPQAPLPEQDRRPVAMQPSQRAAAAPPKSGPPKAAIAAVAVVVLIAIVIAALFGLGIIGGAGA